MAGLPAYTGITFTSTQHSDVPANLTPSQQSLPTPFVACITGASRGIGAAFAIAFAQAGATGLVITARKVESLDETKKQCLEAAKSKQLRVTCLAANASSDESVAENIAETIKKEHGRLDLLVNNAGILSTDSSAFGKAEDIKASEIQIPIESNYLARFLTIKHTLPILRSSPNGAKAIVNISSIGSHLVMKGGAMGFSISAFATNRLTEWVSETYKDEGINVFAVHPGAVKTSSPPGMPDWVLDMSKDDPALCGAFCIWLVKENRSWLSGRYLAANWDVAELEARKDEIVNEDKLKMRLVL